MPTIEDKATETMSLITGVEASIDIDAFIEKINGYGDDKNAVMLELQKLEPSVIEFLLTTKKTLSEEDICKFFIEFSNHIDLNTVVDAGKTMLHLMAEKDMIKLSSLVLSGDIKFVTAIDLDVVATDGMSIVDAAGEATQKMFEEALSKAFESRVVLVHTMANNSICEFLINVEALELIDWDTPSRSVTNAIANRSDLITDAGVLGSHLNFMAHQYGNGFIDRPHSHWYMNQLCHSNSGGSWEDSAIAVLDPLSEFSCVSGIAPYDTTVMGPHRLSKQSVILVPEDVVEGIRARLNSESESGFRGTVLGFTPEKTLREAVNETMKKRFPNSLKLRNAAGEDTAGLVLDREDAGSHGYSFSTGNFEVLSVALEGGMSRELMMGPSTASLPTFKAYSKGRHLGLHNGSTTDLEGDHAGDVITMLKRVSKDPGNISAHMDNVVAKSGDKTVSHLFTYKAYELYTRLNEDFVDGTGAHDFAMYVMKKAIMAEIRGYFYEINQGLSPELRHDLNPELLERIVEHSFPQFLVVLADLDEEEPDFSAYRTLLDTYKPAPKLSASGSRFFQTPPSELTTSEPKPDGVEVGPGASFGISAGGSDD